MQVAHSLSRLQLLQLLMLQALHSAPFWVGCSPTGQALHTLSAGQLRQLGTVQRKQAEPALV